MEQWHTIDNGVISAIVAPRGLAVLTLIGASATFNVSNDAFAFSFGDGLPVTSSNLPPPSITHHTRDTISLEYSSDAQFATISASYSLPTGAAYITKSVIRGVSGAGRCEN